MKPNKDSAARRLAAVLNRPVFRINNIACSAAAQTIKGYLASVAHMPWGSLPKANQLAFKLAFVGICHQFNWDFLQARLSKHLLSPDLTRMIELLSSVSANDLSEWLKGYRKPERVQATERAAILRSIGKVLKSHYGGDPFAVVRASGDQIGGPSGFIAELDRFETYRLDALRKKSNVLVQDLIRERIVRFKDEDSLQPAIDYHIMRLYLRSGRVIPLYDVVAEVLKGKPRPRPRLVRLLRTAVAEALQATASYAGLSVADVNYIEWQLGRSVCAPRRPLCLSDGRAKGIDPDVGKLFTGSCPYIEFCQARHDPEWCKLKEPNFISTFY